MTAGQDRVHYGWCEESKLEDASDVTLVFIIRLRERAHGRKPTRDQILPPLMGVRDHLDQSRIRLSWFLTAGRIQNELRFEPATAQFDRQNNCNRGLITRAVTRFSIQIRPVGRSDAAVVSRFNMSKSPQGPSDESQRGSPTR